MTDYSAELRTYVRQKNTPEDLSRDLSGCELAIVFDEAKSVIGVGVLEVDVIKRVYVDPAEHGNGVGSAIMESLETHAKSLGLHSAGLGSLPGAESFYVACGYTVRKRCTVEINGMEMPSIQMEKNF